MKRRYNRARSHHVPNYGGVCDRCASPYLIGNFPNLALCPGCYLGAMEPAQRARLIGYVKKTGSRIT